jgi:hypothetical protein
LIATKSRIDKNRNGGLKMAEYTKEIDRDKVQNRQEQKWRVKNGRVYKRD